MLICDINCDMGEGMGNEEELMPFISSANIACGYHAGDRDTMKKVIDLCLEFNIAIGAHPSYPDKENFGRTDMVGISLQARDVQNIVSEQVFILKQVAKEAGAKLHHVKPHGALYNRAAWDEEVAEYICKALISTGNRLLLYGLSGSKMKAVAAKYALDFREEVFADRTYKDNGSLTPRTEENALIDNSEDVVSQVLEMVQNKRVRTTLGKYIPVEAKTICIHGDGKHAVEFARKIYQALKRK
jgi:5-oxoprolinase (ATP-hydrolysing) subunit A